VALFNSGVETLDVSDPTRPVSDNDEIAATLTSIGLEVEEIANIDLGFTGVVTARVESAQPHPNADKLRVCKVTDGNETYDVVCGAPNVREGLTVER